MIPHNTVSSALAMGGKYNRYPRRRYYPFSHRQQSSKEEFRTILMERIAEANEQTNVVNDKH